MRGPPAPSVPRAPARCCLRRGRSHLKMDGGGASSGAAGRDVEISAEARYRVAQEIELRLLGGGPRGADRRTLRDQQENRRALAAGQRLDGEGERGCRSAGEPRPQPMHKRRLEALAIPPKRG